jgi:hypothetical protein
MTYQQWHGDCNNCIILKHRRTAALSRSVEASSCFVELPSSSLYFSFFVPIVVVALLAMGIDWSKACSAANAQTLDMLVTTLYTVGGCTVRFSQYPRRVAIITF